MIDRFLICPDVSHLGLIAYNTRRELVLDETEAPFERLVLRSRVAREVSFQWLGNLVSPDWWRHVWISEGVAEYFQYIVWTKVGTSEHDRYQMKRYHRSSVII